jgi:hypothetical protein
MAQPPHTQIACKEADISLAISAIVQDNLLSVKCAASIFDCPRTTVQRRRAGIAARRDCEPNSKKLSKLEEEVITEYIINLDTRGFSPTLGAVRDMADKLLAEHGAGQVGRDWPKNFVKRTESLKTRFN